MNDDRSDPVMPFERHTPAGLREWACMLSDDDLRAAITEWEKTQCECGAGKARADANRRLGYLRREQKRRWFLGQ